jgi:hypothetical protein
MPPMLSSRDEVGTSSCVVVTVVKVSVMTLPPP